MNKNIYFIIFLVLSSLNIFGSNKKLDQIPQEVSTFICEYLDDKTYNKQKDLESLLSVNKKMNAITKYYFQIRKHLVEIKTIKKNTKFLKQIKSSFYQKIALKNSNKKHDYSIESNQTFINWCIKLKNKVIEISPGSISNKILLNLILKLPYCKVVKLNLYSLAEDFCTSKINSLNKNFMKKIEIKIPPNCSSKNYSDYDFKDIIRLNNIKNFFEKNKIKVKIPYIKKIFEKKFVFNPYQNEIINNDFINNNIKNIEISGYGNLNMANITKLPNLETINYIIEYNVLSERHTPLSILNKNPSILKKILKLKTFHLILESYNYKIHKTANALISNITEFTNINTFLIHQSPCALSDVGGLLEKNNIKKIANMKTLKKLTISNFQIKSLKELSKSKTLETLIINRLPRCYCPFNKEFFNTLNDFSHITSLQNLKILKLYKIPRIYFTRTNTFDKKNLSHYYNVIRDVYIDEKNNMILYHNSKAFKINMNPKYENLKNTISYLSEKKILVDAPFFIPPKKFNKNFTNPDIKSFSNNSKAILNDKNLTSEQQTKLISFLRQVLY